MKVSLVVSALAVLLSCTHVHGAWEYMIPMRDGVKLHTYVDMPLDGRTTDLVAVMDRSPYGAWALELIADIFMVAQHHVAIRQDMRGTGQSEGNFTIWHNAADDAYDTMEWISKQSWSNGVVYSCGASADGLAAFTQPLAQPKWLQAQFIIFASSVGYPIIFVGGAYREALGNLWISSTVPTQAGPLIEEVKAHEAPGPWWDALNLTTHYDNVNFPAVMWSGWYDIFLVGNLIGFHGYQYESDPSVQGKMSIIVDPLGHCQSGAKYFPKNTILGRVTLGIWQALNLFSGKPTSEPEGVSAVTFYVMASTESNSTGNYWTSLPKFPTFAPKKLFLQPGGGLSFNAPTDADASTKYVYDPTNPVPTIGGNNLKLKCGPLDQRPVESRPDVIVFTSDVLERIVPLTGPLNAVVYVSSSAVDTDFTAKLSDVYPDGTSRLIQDGIVRMRWRDLPHPEPHLMTPGTVYEVTITLWNTSYVFQPNHRMRVAISSSNFRRFSVNPNNGLPLIANGPNITATNTIYHSSKYPSHLVLPEVSMGQLPPHGVLNADEETIRQVVGPEVWDIGKPAMERYFDYLSNKMPEAAANNHLRR